MTVPSETPTDTPANWTKTHDGEGAKIWRNGEGDMIALTQSFNSVTDYWEVTDTTGAVVEKRSCGPFETYLDALGYVNTFLPRFGRDELPDDVAEVPDDEIVEIARLPQTQRRPPAFDNHVQSRRLQSRYHEQQDSPLQGSKPETVLV
jgi:hypothetical protein